MTRLHLKTAHRVTDLGYSSSNVCYHVHERFAGAPILLLGHLHPRLTTDATRTIASVLGQGVAESLPEEEAHPRVPLRALLAAVQSA